MVKPNYRQQKRQKEISKKARHDEKMLKRSARLATPGSEDQPGDSPADTPAVSQAADAAHSAAAEAAAPEASQPATTV